MIKSSIIVICLFGYYYSMGLGPLPITFKMLLGAVGAFLFFIKRVRLYYRYQKILVSLMLVIFWSIISCVINSSNQIIFLKDFLSLVMNFFAAFAFVSISKDRIKGIDELLSYIVLVAVIQSVIEIAAFFVPDFQSFISPFVSQDEDIVNSISSFDRYRLMGVGTAAAFGILTTSSLAILACTYMIFHAGREKRIIYIIAYIIISLCSYFTARTIALSIIVSIILTFYYMYKHHKINILLLVGLSLLITNIPILLRLVLPESMINWAFNDFSSDKEGNTFSIVYSWLTETRFDFKTFMIGDGFFSVNGAYYKSIDLGWFRMIFYFGILGTILLVSYQYRIAKFIIVLTRSNRDFIALIWAFCICYVFIMAKGYMTIVNELLFLLVMIDYGNLFVSSTPVSKNICNHVYKE